MCRPQTSAPSSRALFGITQAEIANQLKIDEKTLRKHFRGELSSGKFPKIRENFESLNVRRIEAGKRDYGDKPNDEPLEELSLSMSYGTDGSEKIQERHDILAQFLFDGVALSPLPQLDPTRLFSNDEKLILYHLAGSRCQLSRNGVVCGRAVPFDEAAIDHINPHCRGGKTELANGRYVARACNIARGIRDDFDPATECLGLRQAPD
jgi:hypothetical protein